MDQEAKEGSVKPKLTKADQDAYMRASELKWNQPVMFGDKPAKASGARGVVLVFKIKGRLVEMRAGDPRLLEMKVSD